MNPKVDVFLPCYNSSETIQRTIESIVVQSFDSFRVILVDNNSKDNSVALFESYNDERFVVKRHNESVSLGANFNRCLGYVEADYYCIMHTDDEYQPNYLASMFAEISSHPDVMLAFCNANIINEESKKVSSIKNRIKQRAVSFENVEYSGLEGLLWISEYNKVVAPSVMYNRKIIDVTGNFDPSLKFTLDWDYYYRTLKSSGSILRINKTLFNYRIHSKQQTAILIASMEKYHEMKSLLDNVHDYVTTTYSMPSKKRYHFLKCTIMVDILVDIKSFKFNSASHKFLFMLGLFC